MKNTDPKSIAEIVLWDMYGNHQAAEQYCRGIDSSAYKAAAEILKAQNPNGQKAVSEN